MGYKKVVVISLMLVLAAVVGAACASKYEYSGTLFDPPQPLADFELLDTSQQPFHLSDLRGNVVLLFFGYTFCPDVCPTTMAEVKNVLADFKDRNRVNVVFITVDPDRDTPAALRQYLDNFSPQFIGLTDDYAKIQQVMQPFGAAAQKQTVSNSAAGYLVNHTARLYLITPQQQLLLTYPFGFDPAGLRRDLAQVLAQSPAPQ